MAAQRIELPRKKNPTLKVLVASLRILPKPSDLVQEGHNDKPRQARIA